MEPKPKPEKQSPRICGFGLPEELTGQAKAPNCNGSYKSC